jgi:hypothetical protein
MRLTLRTLLGYLDDILEPQQAKELGEKINESQVASALVARIKEVLRRRRIGAPEITGPGSDPDCNVVAEYLDNTLSPEKIEDLERLCLDSDLHLAEVAACHQILTLVLGEPVDISQSLRERMYALGKVTERAGEDGRPRTAPVAPPGPAPTPAVPPRPEIPDYLAASPTWRRVAPIVVAILVLGVWIGLILSDPAHPWRTWSSPSASTIAGQPAPGEGSGNGQPPAPAIPPDGAPPTPEPEEMVPAEAVAPTPAPAPDVAAARAAPEPQPEPLPDRDSVPINPPSPPDSPEPGTTEAPPTPSASPRPTTVAGGAAPSTGAPAAAPAAPPAALEAKRVLYNSAEGVLLNRAPGDRWLVLPRRSLIHSGDEVASPEPFESVLQLLDAEAEIVLNGARIVWQATPPAADAALEINRGRVIVRKSPLAAAGRTLRLQLGIGGGVYLLELLEPGTVCGIEVKWQPSAGGPDVAQSLSFDGGLYLAAGRAKLTAANGTVWMLESGMAGLAFLSSRPAASVQPLLTLPDWLLPSSSGMAVVARQTARQFEEAFQLDLSISETIPALVGNRLPRLSELATQVLALTDQYPALIRALSAPHEESRRAAILGLGTWLRADPANAPLLEAEVDRSFPPQTAAAVLRLLYGYTPEDARNPEISNQLVDWLGDSNLAVRELAFQQIRKLTGGTLTYMYHPDRPESQRAVSVRQWKNHVRKEGALVNPTAAPPAAP